MKEKKYILREKNAKKNLSLKNWLINSFKRGAWAPILVFLVHVIAIGLLRIYQIFPAFDIPMHFLGGVAITYFFLQSVISAYEEELLGKPTYQLIMMLIVLLTATTTVLWEFSEWTIDHFLLTSTQVSIADTMLDMFLGIIGGVVVVFLNISNLRKKIK